MVFQPKHVSVVATLAILGLSAAHALTPVHWNAYVAVTQMGGQGNFTDPRLKIDITHSPDLVSSKLPALRAYQYSLPVPRPAAKSFNADGAASGRAVFNRNCGTCGGR